MKRNKHFDCSNRNAEKVYLLLYVNSSVRQIFTSYMLVLSDIVICSQNKINVKFTTSTIPNYFLRQIGLRLTTILPGGTQKLERACPCLENTQIINGNWKVFPNLRGSYEKRGRGSFRPSTLDVKSARL